jgi:hypothetical protein
MVSRENTSDEVWMVDGGSLSNIEMDVESSSERGDGCMYTLLQLQCKLPLKESIATRLNGGP